RRHTRLVSDWSSGVCSSDLERAGGFAPLRFVPPPKMVVLGLISSKEPALESQDELLRRIDEASKYIPIERLAISPQCGFASTAQIGRASCRGGGRRSGVGWA